MKLNARVPIKQCKETSGGVHLLEKQTLSNHLLLPQTNAMRSLGYRLLTREPAKYELAKTYVRA